MASQTPKLLFPYPVSTDRVVDGDDSIKALADVLDSYFGTIRKGAGNLQKGTGMLGFKSTSWYPLNVSFQLTLTMSAPALVFLTARTDAQNLAGTGSVGHRIEPDGQSEVFWYDSTGTGTRVEFRSTAWVYVPAGATVFTPAMINFANSASGFTVNTTQWSVVSFGGTPSLA